MVFCALTTEPALLPRLLESSDLPEETRQMAEEGRTFTLGL